MTNTEENIVFGGPYEDLIDTTLGELVLLILKTYGDNVVQIDAATDEQLTANTLLARAIELAKWFRLQGITVGDNISMNSENRLEFCIVPIAAWFVGATFAPLNPDYLPGELKHVLNLSKPRFIFCSERTIEKMMKIQQDNRFIEKLIVFGPQQPPSNVLSFNSLVKNANPEEIDEDFQATSYDRMETVATILCSSGTTGLPKGVMCTHYNMTAFLSIASTQMAHLMDNEDPSDAMMGLVPFFHSFGFMLMFVNIMRGKTMIVIKKFSPKVFLDAIVKYKVARLFVPPPVLLILIKHPLAKTYDLSCIKEVRSGAAPLGRDMEHQLVERLKADNVSQAYGMTETTLGVIMKPVGSQKLGSVGKLLPGMYAKVISEDGKALGPYQEGELCLKGPLIMKGYVNDPTSTNATIDKEQWLHTGDVAYYDNDKYFFIVDRIKELIKYKAFQVAPAELEALLLTHPAVSDSAVIGLPDEEAGELPLAFVVLKKGKKATEAELQKFVEENVSHQKKLRGGVVFVDEIPRNPTGKILRRVLKQRAIKFKSKL